jgi:uncharacterized LabA/DUF88 family protein
MQYKTIVLVDGENLVLRYKEMLGAGRTPCEGVNYIEDAFVWHSGLRKIFGRMDIVRIGYYTTVVGDDKRLEETKKLISESRYQFSRLNGADADGTLVPYVYKKSRKGAKTKSVDINLTIDALRYAYGEAIDQIVLVSGDGDYVPLLREIMSRGKMVKAYALSSGLNKEIKYNVDELLIIDNLYFQNNP